MAPELRPGLFFHRGLLQRAQMEKSGGLSSSESRSMTWAGSFDGRMHHEKMVVPPSQIVNYCDWCDLSNNMQQQIVMYPAKNLN